MERISPFEIKLIKIQKILYFKMYKDHWSVQRVFKINAYIFPHIKQHMNAPLVMKMISHSEKIPVKNFLFMLYFFSPIPK